MKGGVSLAVVAVLVAGCSGGMLRKGEQRVTLRGDYSSPFQSGTTGFGEGLGDADNFGLGAAFEHFLEDGVAVVGGVGYRHYDQSDGSVHAAETEIGFRLFPIVLDHVALSLDIVGGFMVGTRSVPETGTHYNFLLGYGPTLEVRVSERVNVFLGYQLRHLSNGKGNSDIDNPSQNGHRVLAGVALRW